MRKIFFILFLTTICLTVLNADQIQILSPKEKSSVYGIVPVKIKWTGEKPVEKPAFSVSVIESGKETKDPKHPKTEWCELKDYYIEKETKTDKNAEIIYVFCWDTVHVPMPVCQVPLSAHNGEHTLKIEYNNRKDQKEIKVDLKNLTVKVSPENIFSLRTNYDEILENDPEFSGPNLEYKLIPKTITVNVECGKDETYDLTLNIYHMETPFTGLINKEGKYLAKPIMTYTLKNCKGPKQEIVWSGESSNKEKYHKLAEEMQKQIEEANKKLKERNEKLNSMTKEEQNLYMAEQNKKAEEKYKLEDEERKKEIPFIPGTKFKTYHMPSNIEDMENFKTDTPIKVPQSVIGQESKYYGNGVINTPEALYNYTSDLDGKFDYTGIDWTESANKYDFEDIMEFSDGNCPSGVYEAEAIITKHYEYTTKNIKWECEDRQTSRSEYMFSLRAVEDNGEIIYNIWEDEEPYGDLIDEIEKCEKEEEVLVQEAEELMQRKNELKEEELKEIEQNITEKAEKLQEKFETLYAPGGYSYFSPTNHAYRLWDFFGEDASSHITKGYNHYLSEKTFDKEVFGCTDHLCDKGTKASNIGINHTVITHFISKNYDDDLNLVYDIAKDSHGMLYRDHENRWAL